MNQRIGVNHFQRTGSINQFVGARLERPRLGRLGGVGCRVGSPLALPSSALAYPEADQEHEDAPERIDLVDALVH